jgi:tRNA pseudouridine synthase 10
MQGMSCLFWLCLISNKRIFLSWFRDELMNLKAGEEKKTKRYMALCICSDPIESRSLEQLSNIKDLTLSQKTPIRVLHRRPLATRSRVVHSMKAWLLENKTKLCKKGKDVIGCISAKICC